MDRAAGFEPVGRGFKSLRARQIFSGACNSGPPKRSTLMKRVPFCWPIISAALLSVGVRGYGPPPAEQKMERQPIGRIESSATPVKFPSRVVGKHRAGTRAPLRSRSSESLFFEAIELELIVGTSGEVLSAKVMSGPPAFQQQAVAAAKSWKYRPFEKNGKAVTAQITDYLPILPPERRPRRHVPFPKVRDWNSLRISLVRTGCYGSCPSYKVVIKGDGTVTYEGNSFVAISGSHRGSISHVKLLELLEAFRAADFLSLSTAYRLGATDLPTYRISIAFDSVNKSVEDYAGEQVGMPLAVSELEDLIVK
jgi:hypothetical protein